MKSVFSLNLQRYRQLRNFSMEELAGLVGCSKQAISYYEAGKRFPDSKTLRAIAKGLSCEVDMLLKPSNVHFSILDINYRQGGSLNLRAKSEIEESASNYLNNYLELEQIAKEIVVFENPIADIVINNSSDAEKAAKYLRKRWKLSDYPIHNISKLLEDKGIRILKINFGSRFQHEGLSGWAENKTIPVIVINEKQTELTRVRYTILHELGHLLLVINSELSSDSIEKICEVFAGAVLIPTDALIREFGKNRTSLAIPELKRIKELYGISILAIMVRARFSNLINYETFAKWKDSKMSGTDFGKYLGREQPERFDYLLLKCLSQKLIGIDKAARLAGKSQRDFQDIYDNLFEFED